MIGLGLSIVQLAVRQSVDFARGSSLALDFTSGNQTLDPRITFTRASSATRFDSTGTLVTMGNNEARFDYNPTTLAPLGLLIEEQRTNLLLRSEEFQTTWANERSSEQVDVIVSPAGTLTGDKLVEDTTATNSHLILQGVSSLSSGSTLTFTSYIKAAERTSVRLQINDGLSLANAVLANFDVSTGVASATQSIGTFTGASSTITPVGNGWFRCSISGVATGVTAVQCRIFLLSAGSTSYTGDGTSGLYIWGAQLEAGAFPTSYIPTVASQVTRSADVAVMTGTNFSDWFTSVNENTFYVEASKPQTNNANAVLLEGADIKGLTISTDGSGGKARAIVRQGTARMDSGSLAPVFVANSVLKIAAGTSASGSAAAFNGTVISTGTPSQNNWGNELRIGNRIQPPTLISNQWNGHIRQIAYYPRRLANSELQAITA